VAFVALALFYLLHFNSNKIHFVGVCGIKYKGSISPMFCEQILHVQIPKVQKDTDDVTVFLRFLDLPA